MRARCGNSMVTLMFEKLGSCQWEKNGPQCIFTVSKIYCLLFLSTILKLAGPSQNLTKGWELLRSKLRIEPETDLGLYLGCLLSKGTNRLHDGTEVTTMTYNMEGLLKLSVEKYLELVGEDTKLKQVSTPSLPEETKQHKARAPAPGDPKHAVQCPWCSKFDPESSVALQPDASDSQPESVEVQWGALAPHAASILMKLLYAARIARFDLLRSMNTLARKCDKMVHSRWCKVIPSHVLCQLYLGEENDWMGRQWHERLIHCVVCRCWFCRMCTVIEVHFRFSYAYSGETYSVSTCWWEQTPGVCEPFYTWGWDRSRWCNPSNNGSSCTQHLGNVDRLISKVVFSWWQSRDDWCGSFWKESNNAASGKDSWNFYYVFTWAYQQRPLRSHVRDHNEDGRGHPHEGIYKSTSMEKGMHVN